MTIYSDLYRGSTFFLLAINGIFPAKLYLQTDAKELAASKRNAIESKIKEIAHKLGIKKPLELIEIKGLQSIAQAQGNNILPGRAGLAINPELFNVFSMGEIEFIIAHELSHIKANDTLLFAIISGTIGLVTTLAMRIILHSSANPFSTLTIQPLMAHLPSLVGTIASYVTLVFFSKWREECADKLGFSVCSDNGRDGAFRFLEKLKAAKMKHENDTDDSCLSRLSTQIAEALHPPEQARIDYLRKLDFTLLNKKLGIVQNPDGSYTLLDPK